MRVTGHGGRLVVYSVLTGSHAHLANPFPPGCRGFERICFTDDPDLSSDDWSIVRMDPALLDPERESRRPKILPHRFLPDFDISVYIDGTVTFKVDPMVAISHVLDGDSSFACFRHPWRDCVYAEGEEVIRVGYDRETRVREQLDFYRSTGFPEHAGLIAGTMLVRRHNDEHVVALGENWFDQVLRFSKRDQLSFNYIAWKLGFEYAVLPGELTDNDWIDWPSGESRVTADFRDDVYTWLNPDAATSGLSPRRHYLEQGQARGARYALHAWELDRIANKHHTDKGSLYFNAHGYAAIYESLLRHRRNEDLHILELGLLRHDVQARNPLGPYVEAPSLSMWREYFPNARIVGFDIADFSKVPVIPGVRIMRGDLGDVDVLRRLIAESGGRFDVIVDDASHASHHQQMALSWLFPQLNDGGFYFIEDLNFQPAEIELDGIVKTLDWLKRLSRDEAEPTPFISEEQLQYLRTHVESVEFYDSQDRTHGAVPTDAFAAIKKTSAAQAAERSRTTGAP